MTCCQSCVLCQLSLGLMCMALAILQMESRRHSPVLHCCRAGAVERGTGKIYLLLMGWIMFL